MYKMKEVCQMTGLTEKAIRIYMEQKLVEPEVEEGIHRKSYFFKEKDVERLKDVSALRSAGFSVADIRQMLEKPENLSLLIEERKALLEHEILQKRSVQEALEHLTIEEYSDVKKLADTIEPRSVQAKENRKKRWSRNKRWMLVVLLLCVLFGWLGIASGKVGVLILLLSAGLTFGIFAMISALRYLWYGRNAGKMEQRAIGKITAVVEHENVEEYIGERERSTWQDIMAYLTSGLFGEDLWEMLRPDGWYPVISYQKEDDTVIATTRYGGFKNDWQIGEEVCITWKDGKERLVHICNGNVWRKKACVYAVMGMMFLAVFGISSVLLFQKEDIFQDTSGTQKLEYPFHADRIVIQMQNQTYELNEEEREVLRRLFTEAEIGAGKYYHSINAQGVMKIYFYQGEQQIESFIANDFYYVLTSDYMRYPVKSIQMEFRGIELGDTDYVTGFLGNFGGKVRERYLVEELMSIIPDEEEFKDLRVLLADTNHFEGAYNSHNVVGYGFLLTETGYINYFGKQPEENEVGRLEVEWNEEKPVRAVLTAYMHTEKEDVEIYRKEWDFVK